MTKGRKALIITLSCIGGTAITLTAAFFGYCAVYYHADSFAISKCVSDDVITYSQEGKNHVFAPKAAATKGLIFYPGAKVEDRAYAPLANDLAHLGIYTVVCHMNLNLAFFSENAASSVIQGHPNIQFFLGGHSLGGVVASMYAQSHYESLGGLIYCASYSSKDLTKTGLNAYSIYGSNDKVLKTNEYENAKKNQYHLEEYVIEGGNHGNFGSYGKQRGDGEATISAEEQAQIAANKIAEFIKK